MSTLATLLLGGLIGFACAPTAHAEKVGVAAAVNPDAFSSLSGTPSQQLNIGKSIFYSERIKTTASGLVQVLLVDGSTFTVGPNSNLVIDKFVYDPNKKTGEMVATFSKGTMRFIGGKLSKNAGGVKVNTPSGALAIRGGMFQGNTERGIYSFLYGHSLTFRGRNGQTQTVYQPGYTLDLSSGRPTVRLTKPEDTNLFQKAFAGRGTSVAIGEAEQTGNNQPPMTQTVSLQDLISDATATEIDGELAEQQAQVQDSPEPVEPPANNPPPTPEPPPPPPEPVNVDLRVLTPPGTYTAYGNPVLNPGGSGILGGDDNPAVTADDFIWTFEIVDGRLVGTVTDLVASAGPNGETQAADPLSVNFPAVLECTSIGICPVTDATITSNGETKTYQGLAALREDFYAYHLAAPPGGEVPIGTGQSIAVVDAVNNVSGPPNVVLAFGGNAYDFGTPSGRTFGFALTPDVQTNSFAPFASGASTPLIDNRIDEQTGEFLKPQPFVTPLLYKETDGTPESEAVWLQTSLYINTTPRDDETETGFSQESFVNVALGGVEDGGLVGVRRGGSQHSFGCQGDCAQRRTTFVGDLASLESPDGSHFLGKDQPNIVIGLDSTGEARNIGKDIPYDPNDRETVGASTHIGAGLGVLEPQSQSFDGTFDGYATGMVESEVPSSGFTNVVASQSRDDFTIGFDRDANTVWADLTVFDVGGGDVVDNYRLSFGDNGEAENKNRSAYVDDLHYAAVESGAVVSEKGSYYPGSDFAEEGQFSKPFEQSEATSYLVSGEQLGVTQFFPETFEADENGHQPFCADCDFIQWGAWGTRTTFSNGEGSDEYVDNVHLGWWVAGDTSTPAELQDLANKNMYATYNGSAIGTVSSRVHTQGWSTYTASGDVFMDWDFGQRQGNFEISKFDTPNFGSQGLTFAGPMSAPGNPGNHFSGSIAGTLPGDNGGVSGVARGSFVNEGGNAARGIVGNWNVGGNNYKATGIFAGSGQPGPR